MARGRTTRPTPGGTGTTGTRWHQAKSVQPRPLNGPSGPVSVVHRLGRSAAAVVGEDRYAITTNNEAVGASAEHVVALARTWRAQALNPAVLIDGGLDRADVVEVQGTRGDPHGPPLVDVMPALGCQPRSNGLRRAVTPGPSQRQDGPPSLLTRPSGCWASRGCGLPGRVPRSGTNPGSPELGRVGGQVPVPAHSCESVRVRGVHACAHKLHTFPTGRLSSTRKSPGQSGAPGRVRTCDPPLRRCRHRVRTSSPVSSQTPRPGLSPRSGTDRSGANCTQNCTHYRALICPCPARLRGRSGRRHLRPRHTFATPGPA